MWWSFWKKAGWGEENQSTCQNRTNRCTHVYFVSGLCSQTLVEDQRENGIRRKFIPAGKGPVRASTLQVHWKAKLGRMKRCRALGAAPARVMCRMGNIKMAPGQ